MHQQEELVGAMLLRSTRTNKYSLCLCYGLDSKLKNLHQSSLLIFSIFSSLFGFSSGPTYILYQYMPPFRRPSIYYIVFSPLCGGWSLRLLRWHLTFSDTEMKELGRSPSDTQTSQVCNRHLAIGRNQQLKDYKHTHTHTHTQTHKHTHKHTHTHWTAAIRQ